MTQRVDPYLPPIPRELQSNQEVFGYIAQITRMLEDLATMANTSYRPIFKTESETKTTDTTLAADEELRFRIEAKQTVSLRLAVVFDTTSNADFKFGMRGPSSPTLVRIGYQVIDAGETTVEIARNEDFTTTTTLTTTGGSVGFMIGHGVIQNGSTAGEVSFQWAQGTSHADSTIVRLGSVIEYAQI